MQGAAKVEACTRGRELLSTVWFQIYNTRPLRKHSMTALQWIMDSEIDGQNRRPALQLYGFKVCQAKSCTTVSVDHTKPTEVVKDTSCHFKSSARPAIDWLTFRL